MSYAIFREHYLYPRWGYFGKPYFKEPSLVARISKYIGFSSRYYKEANENISLGLLIDPAQKYIEDWCKTFYLDLAIFSNRPKAVLIPNTKERISSLYDSKDLCSLFLDTLKNSDDNKFDDGYCLWDRWEGVFSMPVGFIECRFFIAEI